MDKRKMHRWLQKKMKRIARSGDKVAPQYAEETIHKLRTDTKKLRALLRLHDHPGVLPRSFKALYQAAGTLRDIQVQQHTRPPLPAGYNHYLAHQLAIAKKEWLEPDHQKILRKATEKMQRYKVAPMTTHGPERYFSATIAHIASLAASDADDDALHTIRKHLKDLLYIAQWCRKHWPKAFARLKAYPIAGLKKISEQAGAYNDFRLGMGRFSTWLQEETAVRQQTKGLAIFSKLLIKKQHMRERLLRSVRQFANKEAAPR